MRSLKNLPAFVVALLLVVCIVAAYLTRDVSVSRVARKPAAANQTLVVDDRLLQTARQMSGLAETNDEQSLAAEALRLSDHEVDQAFAAAIRDAAAATPPSSGPLKQLADRIAGLKARMAADQERIAKLTKDAETKPAAADKLELAKAQLALDQDELDDAQEDLARMGGDQQAKIQQALAQHEALQHQNTTPKTAAASSTATLSEQVQRWLELRDREEQLDTARQQAANYAATLSREHDTLEKLIKKQPIPDTTAAAPSSDESADEEEEQEDTATMVARLRHLSDQRKALTALDQRIQDSQQLADIYKRWTGVVETRQLGVVHLLLQSLAAIFGVVLLVILIMKTIQRRFGQQTDRKRLHQLRVIFSIAVEAVGVLVILLIIFGRPTQMATIIGLTTAGLTVVMKDFIVAFFGWFALLGKNGVRVGDWVEINGVSGEVIEIGVLKTVLLEMGNWTSTGHPTGRRVAFMNGYALEGHYFNFSTAGQWLWDELQVMLPVEGDPYQTAEQIRQVVERETAADATEAEREWERVTRQYGTRLFSAKPAVDLRPSVNGLSVNVRYITRAPQRYEMKSHLFTAIVDVLRKPAGSGVNQV
ncbi:MAG TPA: mechanosensitive ion channel domain-containing protein [Bryobacteraceae bacterium]|nr:mechanosensitive ion channel domain-containing protein [Bryobacteraceae bacterium]